MPARVIPTRVKADSITHPWNYTKESIRPAYNRHPTVYHETCDNRGQTRPGLVADDGSTDGTCDEACRGRLVDSVIVVHYSLNNGKGNALKEGFKHATGDYVVFLDSDLDLHPSQLHLLFRVMRNNRADVVIGSKHHPKSRLEYPFARKVISRVYALILKALFNLPLRDTQTGLKVFNLEVLKKVFPKVLCKNELLVNANHLDKVAVLNFRAVKWGRIGLKTSITRGRYNGYLLPYPRYYDSIKT